MPEQRFKVAAAANHVENQNPLVLQAIDDDVLPDDEAPQTWAQIFVATPANVRKAASRKNRSVMSVMESITRSAISM